MSFQNFEICGELRSQCLDASTAESLGFAIRLLTYLRRRINFYLIAWATGVVLKDPHDQLPLFRLRIPAPSIWRRQMGEAVDNDDTFKTYDVGNYYAAPAWRLGARLMTSL